MNENKVVFLGGTCNDSKWRDQLIQMINIQYFNPVVEDWTEECMAEEIRQRETCDYCLYTITPLMKGVYSIAEVIDDSNKRPLKTIFCLLNEDSYNEPSNAHIYLGNKTIGKSTIKKFDDAELKSLNQVGEMVIRNGGKYFTNLKDVADFLNGNN